MERNALVQMTRLFFLTFIFILLVHPWNCSQKKSTVQIETKDLISALKSGKPVLADFGRGFCIPCKKMKPILEELSKEYEGKVIVLILDLKDHMDEARKQGVRVIPTQIFFDKNQKEIYRHEGFMPKEDIVKKFFEMGVK